MITGQLARDREGFQHIANPCFKCCVDQITKQNIRSMFKTEDVW